MNDRSDANGADELDGANRHRIGDDTKEHGSTGTAAGALSTQEVMMLELVAAGHSHAAAGAAAGRSSKTVQRLVKRQDARAFVRSAQAARLDQVVGLLGMASVDAAQVVLDELQGESAASRLRAAALVLGSFERLRSAARQDSVVDELRRGLEQLQAQLDAEEDGDD